MWRAIARTQSRVLRVHGCPGTLADSESQQRRVSKLGWPRGRAMCTVWMLMCENRVTRAAGKKGTGVGHQVGEVQDRHWQPGRETFVGLKTLPTGRAGEPGQNCWQQRVCPNDRYFECQRRRECSSWIFRKGDYHDGKWPLLWNCSETVENVAR